MVEIPLTGISNCEANRMKTPFIALAASLAVFAGFAPFAGNNLFAERGGSAKAILNSSSQSNVTAPAGIFDIGARADEAAPLPSTIDFSKLLRIGDDQSIALASTVSTDVKKVSTIRKIGYGRETIVRIVTSASGTYSTDGLASPYVRYPGVTVSRAVVGNTSGYATLNGDSAWHKLTFPDAGSFVTIGEIMDSGNFATDGTQTCFSAGTYRGCI